MSAETVQQMAIALAVITSASAINRFYVRLRISHAVSVADWTILLALLLYLSLCMVTSMLASLSRAAMLYHKLSFVLYALAATATKINIGTWIPAPKLWPSGMLVTTPCLVCQALLTIAVIAIIFMPCEATTTSICYADADAYSTLAWATLNAVSTVILLITGVRRIVVDRQKISTRLRAVAAAVSLLGLGSLAAAITTALFFAQTLTISLPITSTESFSNESSLRTAIPALLDVALAIICACTLVLQPQFARWLPLHATTASSPLRPRRPSSSTSSSSPSRSSSVVSKWSEKSIIFIPEIVVTPPTPEVSRPTLLPRLQDPRNDAAKRRDRSGPTTRHHPQRPRLGRRQEAAAIYQWRNPADIIADPSLAWRADAEKPAEVCVVTRELREGEESPPLNRMPSEVEAKAIYFVTGAPLPYKAQDCWVRPGQGFMRDTV